MNEFHSLKTEGDGVNLHLGINKRNKTNLNKKNNNSNLKTVEDKKERINIIKKSSKHKSNLYSKIEKKIKLVEYVIFKKKILIITLLFNHVSVMAR